MDFSSYRIFRRKYKCIPRANPDPVRILEVPGDWRTLGMADNHQPARFQPVE
jgi:hypothetical protein